MADQASQPTDLAEDANGAFATTELIEPAAEASTPAADVPASTVEPIRGPVDGVEADHDDLLGELARAMHAAAASQYERINAELERRRAEQVESIAARASSEVQDLKAGLEADIRAIDAWAKAETEKIKHNRLGRIDARREQLANRLERQETIKSREVFAIEVAIDAHRNEVDSFFGRMEREADPAAIAQVASTMPQFPPLAKIAEEARQGAAAEFASLDEQAGPAPVADDLEGEGSVSESRLMAVMDPGASRGDDGEAARPWESEPYAVSVAAGPSVTDETNEVEPPTRVGSTLLRTVRSIRPMAGRHESETGEDDAQR
ncbi:MAG: hypothetical protein Q7S35_03945 [Candidatus Limnocylindrales bacterium]|nr:hypothetical protein [Candidatus Limnocylindrales bacterium]